jgi:hypothetical protein
MVEFKQIVCLANSRKLGGRCIAGKEVLDKRVGGWIRPVSAREHEEVCGDECLCANGSEPHVLDALEIPFIAPKPKTYQQENWLLDPSRKWKKTGRLPWDKLPKLEDPLAPLWHNGCSTFHGRNDRIPFAKTIGIGSSLRLIRINTLKLSVFAPGEKYEDYTRRVQGIFSFLGMEYKLRVTDLTYEERYLSQPDAEHELGECFLTISLGDLNPKDSCCYKLVAAIMERTESRVV